MTKRTLGEELRRILLTASLAGGMGATPAPSAPVAPAPREQPIPSCPERYEPVAVAVPKAARLPDGGIDFGVVCATQSCKPETCAAHHTDGGLEAVCIQPVLCPGGRRPAGFSAASETWNDPLPDFFAEAARLEAASIQAFRVLARELSELGAPVKLIRAARRAAREEVHHTRLTRGLARRYGKAPPSPALPRPGVRGSLEAIATENAIEGCVRETYGALVALCQRERAEDPAVAAALSVIAPDEVGHAALAFEVDAWLQPRLSRAARARVRAARRAGFLQLADEADRPVDARLARTAGLPAQAEAHRGVQALAATFAEA